MLIPDIMFILHENQCFGSQNLGIRVELSNIKPLISKKLIFSVTEQDF